MNRTENEIPNKNEKKVQDTEKSSLEIAEQGIRKSLDRFEAAMENLVEKVEVTNQKLNHVREVVSDSKRNFFHFKDEVQATVSPFVPSIVQIKNVTSKIRNLPQPVLWLAAGLMGYAAFKLWRKGYLERTQNSLSSKSVENDILYQ